MSKANFLTNPKVLYPLLGAGVFAACAGIILSAKSDRDEVKQTFSQASRADQLASIKKGHVYVACIDKGTSLEERVNPNTTDDLESLYSAGCKVKRFAQNYELPTGYNSSSPR